MPIDRDGDGPQLRRPDSKVSLTPGDGRSTDLRATPFTDDVFNDDYYGRRPHRSGEGRPEGGRSYSVIVGVVLGLAVAGGGAWYLLKGSGVTFTPGAVGFIKADPTPYKVRPDNPGGMQVENQDKLVYDRVAKGQTPNRVENLLPPAEEPKAPPMKPAVPAAVPAPPPVEAAKPTEPAPAPEVAKVEPPKPEPAPEAAKPEASPPPPAKTEAKPAAPAADPLAAAVAAATGGRTSATGPIEVKPEAKPEAPAAEPTPAPAAPAAAAPEPQVAAATAGAYQIQLASVLSEDAAMAEWKRLSGKNKDILGAYKPAVTKADLGDRGVFYRLRAGPLADKAAADALCASLAAVNVGCIVVRP